MKIIDEEGCQGAGEDHRHKRALGGASHIKPDKTQGGNHADTGTKPVHVVEKIKRIGDSHYPDNGDHGI